MGKFDPLEEAKKILDNLRKNENKDDNPLDPLTLLKDIGEKHGLEIGYVTVTRYRKIDGGDDDIENPYRYHIVVSKGLTIDEALGLLERAKFDLLDFSTYGEPIDEEDGGGDGDVPVR